MSRAKNHSIETKAFTSYVTAYFEKYHEISDKFREETKDGKRLSKDTINAMTSHYNSSTLREKYIAALSSQEGKLRRSNHVDASKYLKDVQGRLETLFKKDLPGFANESASKNQWIDFSKRYSESSKRNPVRESVKGGAENIHKHIMAMLSQGRKLNRDKIKDNDIGDIFFRIQKEISSRSKTIYKGGAALTSVAGTLSATMELEDNLIGNQDFINDEVTETKTDSEVVEGMDTTGNTGNGDTTDSLGDTGWNGDTTDSLGSSSGNQVGSAGGSEQTIEGGGGEGGEISGNDFENSTEVFTQTQVFQALQYAILVAMIVMVVVVVVATVTNICSQIERERQAKSKTDDAVTEKLDGKEKRKEDKYIKRADFLNELEAITEKSR